MIKARLVCLVLLAATLVLPMHRSSAQSGESIFDQIKREHEWIEKHLHHRDSATAQAAIHTLDVTPQQSVDVKHYRLQIQLNPAASTIAGTVTIDAAAIAVISALNIDAQDNLTIDAVRVDGAVRSFTRTSERVTVNFTDALTIGKPFAVAIDYHGTPVVANRLGGGMLVAEHGPDGATAMASLSEPFAAPSWWPCIDNPSDKATSETEITVPQGYTAASNGALVKTEATPSQTTTFFWREDYPLANYLISVAATNYVRFEDTYTAMDGRKMPLVYYVYPEHLELAQLKFAITRRALEIFAPLFGEYPFLNEKYGMAEFPWSGGMEHQTLTSLGANIIGSVTNSGQSVIAHELAHQWWGDLVTMRTWDDIWLNEGFATYSEVLFFERFAGLAAGDLMHNSYDDGKTFGRMGGTIKAENLSDPFDDTGAIYTKGAWVLHMLRHLLGDQPFFDALKEYASRYGFGNASTLDFQTVCEAHYGDKLDWFFQQWMSAPGRPFYKASSDISTRDASGNYTVTLTIKQKQSHEIPGRAQSVYIMPLDVTIHYADGSAETRVIRNDARKQSFSFTVSKRPVDVGLDEGHWVLKKLK